MAAMTVAVSLHRPTLLLPKCCSLPSNTTGVPKYSTSRVDYCFSFSKRKTVIFAAASIFASLLNFNPNPQPQESLSQSGAFAAQQYEQDDEDRIVRIFQEASPCVVFIQDLELVKNSKSTTNVKLTDEGDAKVVGTGSGFIWDKFGYIVTNYHVVTKLATDRSGLQRCKVSLTDADGNKLSKEAQIIGFAPSYDLAVLKVDAGGTKLKPVDLGTSNDLHVGQSCFAIGNPYGYENTLTTGVVSGLGREIPSPNGQAIQGAIQTDAAINADLDEVDGRILGKKPSPSIREAFAELRRKESRKKVMMGPNPGSDVYYSALATQHPEKSDSRRRERPWCEHCNKKGQAKDTCWKLHGKPADWKPKNQQESWGLTVGKVVPSLSPLNKLSNCICSSILVFCPLHPQTTGLSYAEPTQEIQVVH